jgi:hypothetical protein
LEEVTRTALLATTGAMALVLASVHLFAGRLRFLDGVPRSRWLSLAGGVSVAYVFVHVLPDLSEGQKAIQQTVGPGPLTQHAYLAAVAGLAVFYGLERAVRGQKGRAAGEEATETSAPLFWIHIGSFAIYNALIGYLLLHREVPGLASLTLYFVAMALHFVVNDYGLREVYKSGYRRARWILAAVALIGWAFGAVTVVHEAAVALLFAFLAGGVVLNVLKEELPEERKSRFLPFGRCRGLRGAACRRFLTVFHSGLSLGPRC